MEIQQRIPRNLQEPTRIFGMAPLELAGCALTFAVLSAILRGAPFSALVSLVLTATIGIGLLTLNRHYPPQQGILWSLQLFRPQVLSVMPFGSEKQNEQP